MKRWLVIAGSWPLLAATAAGAQSNRGFDLTTAPTRHPRTVDLRLLEEPALTRQGPPSTGFIAETEVAPNAMIGFRMMSVARPKLGPEWRVDGRSTRARKPAVSFSWRF